MMVNSLIDETLERINQKYQPGTLVWTKVNKPDEWGKILTLEGRIDEMALESNLKGLREALDEYQGLILAMVKEFRAIREEKGQRMFKFVERPQSPWGGLRAKVRKSQKDSNLGTMWAQAKQKPLEINH